MLSPAPQPEVEAPNPRWGRAATRHPEKSQRQLTAAEAVTRWTENIPPPSRTVPERIVAAALAMTDEVYDTFQIRTVAQRANVSPSTLYRYFPSKDALLVATLDLWLARFVSDVERELILMSMPLRRLRHLTARITSELRGHPLLADAFVRAYLLATCTQLNSDMLRDSVSRAFAYALSPAGAHQTAVTDLVTDVWGANVPAMIQNRISVDDLQERLERTVRAVETAAAFDEEAAG